MCHTPTRYTKSSQAESASGSTSTQGHAPLVEEAALLGKTWSKAVFELLDTTFGFQQVCSCAATFRRGRISSGLLLCCIRSGVVHSPLLRPPSGNSMQCQAMLAEEVA